MIKKIAGIIISFVFIGCKTIQPTEPKLSFASCVPATKPSFVNMPIHVSYAGLENEINNAVQEDFVLYGKTTERLAIILGFKIEKDFYYEASASRGRFLIRGAGNNLSLKTDVKYWAYLYTNTIWPFKASVSCGREKIIDVEAGTTTYLLKSFDNLGYNCNFGIANNWGLNLGITPLEIKTVAPCYVSFLSIDASKIIKGLITQKMGDLGNKLSSDIKSKANLRNKIQSAWTEIQKPYTISQNNWFSINPERLYFTGLNCSDTALDVKVGMKAYPIVENRTLPPPLMNHPLPDMDGTQPDFDGFNINLTAKVSFDQLKDSLDNLLHKKYRHFLRSFKIHSIDFIPSNDLLNLKLNVHGGINGTIYISGKPVYDNITDTLKLTDIDYTIETKELIPNWVDKTTLLNDIGDIFNFNFKASKNTEITKLNSYLNRKLSPDVELKGKITSIDFTNLCADGQFLNFVFNAVGEIGIDIR